MLISTAWLLTTVNHHPLALSLMNGVFLGVREYDLPTQKISLMTLLATNISPSAIFDDDFLQLPQVKQTASFTLERSISLQTTFFHSLGSRLGGEFKVFLQRMQDSAGCMELRAKTKEI